MTKTWLSIVIRVQRPLLHKKSAIRFETGSCTLIFRLSSLIMGPTVFRLSTISSAVWYGGTAQFCLLVNFGYTPCRYFKRGRLKIISYHLFSEDKILKILFEDFLGGTSGRIFWEELLRETSGRNFRGRNSGKKFGDKILGQNSGRNFWEELLGGTLGDEILRQNFGTKFWDNILGQNSGTKL